MHRFVLLLLVLFSFSNTGNAQSLVKKHIKKGRRNKSEHQLTIAKNELEADWEFGNEIITDSLRTYVYPNLVIRYGVSKLVELNVEINPITTVQELPAGKQKIAGIEPVLIGARIALQDETKWVPEIALSMQLAPPFAATKKYVATYWAPLVQCTMQKNFKKHFSVSGSGGFFDDGFSTKPTWLYSLTPAYNINKKVSIGADIFGFAATHMLPLNNMDIDFACQLNKRLNLGATAGTGISSKAHKGYVGINGSFVLIQQHDKKKNKPEPLTE